MRVVQINTFSYKAAGNIMMNLHKSMLEQGIDSYVAWGRGRKSENKHEFYMEDELGVKLHGVYTRITDKHGFGSVSATKKLIKWIDSINPDIIHLHCIHGYYINIELLFHYIREKKKKVIWTQHDCWAFTGHCVYFDMCGCEKWKTGCYNCEQLNTYPASKIYDNSKWNWKKKKELFTGLDIKLVCPSEWLRDVISQSFFDKYDSCVIHNGINLDKFHPFEYQDVKKKYELDERPIVLCVAGEWTERKGLKDIIKIADILKDYQFIVVGLNDKQILTVPNSIISIKRTENFAELAKLYSAADLFFNPTYEEVFGMVNVEALACGTPVITYNTGGSPEAIDKGNVKEIGKVLKKTNNIEINLSNVCKSIEEYLFIKNERVSNACIEQAKKFDMNLMIGNYLDLYEKVNK